MVKSRYIGDGHPTFHRNPYNGYINPYYWVDDHPLLNGNNGSLDPGTYRCFQKYGETPQIIHLFIGFGTMIFTIHFGVPVFFWKHPYGNPKFSTTFNEGFLALAVVGSTNKNNNQVIQCVTFLSPIVGGHLTSESVT